MLVNLNRFSFAFNAKSVYWKVPVPEVNGKLLDAESASSYILPHQYWCPTEEHSLYFYLVLRPCCCFFKLYIVLHQHLNVCVR